MKRTKWLSGLATAALLAAAPMQLAGPLGVTTVQAQEARVSFNIFFDDLRPHGLWVQHARYNYVWCPDVDVRWRPYTNGRWLYLRDRGWYFESDEPFAWAVYHYGRWVDDARLGWCWVPGNHWAPAWVSWRRGGDYIGWAPLPPERDGFQIDIEVNVGEPPQDDWVFIPVRRFIEPRLSINLVLGSQQPDIFARSEYAGPVIIQNNVVINNVIDIDIIEQETEAPVPVVEAAMVSEQSEAAADPESGTIEVFSPEIAAPEENAAPPEAVDEEQAAQELPQAQAPDEDNAAPPEGDAAAGTAEGEQPDATAPADPAVEAGAGADAEVDAEAGAAGDEADPAAPTEQPAAPVECAEGEALVDGACVAIEAEATTEAETEAGTEPQPTEEAAPAEEAPAEEPAQPEEAPVEPVPEEAAPVEAVPDEAPVEEPVPQGPVCEEGFELIDGVCLPIAGAAAPAEGLTEEAPAQ